MDKGNKRPTAQTFKDQGNHAFKRGDYKAAIEHYTSAIKADPSDHVLPCNRALARLKLEQWKLAEADCTRSLQLLPEPNCKALFRRGTARKQLGMWTDALNDLTTALALEPTNPSIRAELDVVEHHLKVASQKSNLDRPNSSAKKDTSSETRSSISSGSSDSEKDDANQPLPSSSSSATRQASDASTEFIRELSTTRFANPPSLQSSIDVPLGTTSFSDLKRLRDKKEERSSGFRNPYNNPSAQQSLPASNETSHKNIGAKHTIQQVTTGKVPPPLSSRKSISVSPVTSFNDFEMKWGISSQPEFRLSVLEALDHRNVTDLFGEHLEPETLEQIIEAMEVCLKSNEKDRIFKAVHFVQALDQVPRIGTLAMFLQPEHQKVVRDLLAKTESFQPTTLLVNLKNFGI